MSVDRLRPFYGEDTGRRSQTAQTSNNADIGSAIAEKENKPVNDPDQLPTQSCHGILLAIVPVFVKKRCGFF